MLPLLAFDAAAYALMMPLSPLRHADFRLMPPPSLMLLYAFLRSPPIDFRLHRLFAAATFILLILPIDTMPR